MNKINKINNEMKSILNQAKFISIKTRNKIIKLLGEEFDIELKVENYENIDIKITNDGSIIMRDELYQNNNKLSEEEVIERFNKFKEEANYILDKNEINYQKMGDKKNIINLIITIILLIIYIIAIIFIIKSLLRGNFFRVILLCMLLSTYFVPGLKDRVDQTINFIKRKLKR